MQEHEQDRYAEAVIGGTPENFDAIEIQGVREVGRDGDDNVTMEVDNDNSQFFSTYLHMKEGGVQCCGDFGSRTLAQDYARDLSAKHSWPVHDFTKESVA